MKVPARIVSHPFLKLLVRKLEDFICLTRSEEVGGEGGLKATSAMRRSSVWETTIFSFVGVRDWWSRVASRERRTQIRW
jgi:hypothetical protein